MDYPPVLARRHRFRHGYLEVTRHERTMHRWISLGITTAIVLCGIGIWKGITWIRTDWRVEHPAAILHVPKGNVATVAVDENDPLRVEGLVNVYEGDAIRTEAHSTVALVLFDGTRVHMDEETELAIKEMRQGRGNTAIGLELPSGNIWLSLPYITTSGALVHRLTSPMFSLEFPPGTEALIKKNTLAVFDSGNALGIVLRLSGSKAVLYIGEGQQITIPEELPGTEESLYALRTRLDAATMTSPFVEKSRTTLLPPPPKPTPVSSPPPEETLNVLAPKEEELAISSSIEVHGTFGKGVTSVRVNGYPATIEGNTFSQELALPSDEKVDIRIAAIDENGIIIAEQSRTVRRDLKPPTPPTILTPAGSGATFRTVKTEIELRGTAPKGVAGIIVNGYRLQLFQPGNFAWSYLASTNLGNFHPGTNTYEVISIDDAGNHSAPTYITILLEEGEEGIVPLDSLSGNEQRATPALEQSLVRGTASNINDILPKNPPKEPGSLEVTIPTRGESYETSRREFSIYGQTSPNTNTVWVNNFRLQLYQPGNDTWKYIASLPMSTMKRGENVYTIIARDAEGAILDRTEYTVIFKP